MRKFSGITNSNSPEAASPGNFQPEQTMITDEKPGYNPERRGMNIQPYKTEFRNIYK